MHKQYEDEEWCIASLVLASVSWYIQLEVSPSDLTCMEEAVVSLSHSRKILALSDSSALIPKAYNKGSIQGSHDSIAYIE